jgi:dipeptidyl aminopeptidase/acylaminoacyl peptidase
MRHLLTLLLAAAPLAIRAAEPVAPLPVSTFFQAPTITSLTFSPNGKYIACLVPFERRMNLAVIDLEKGTKNLLTNFKDRQAATPLWANNDRILFRVDDDGKESFSLYAVNRDGKDPVILAAGYDKAGSESGVNVRFRSILRRIENDPNGILVLANLTHRDWSDVARMSLKSGEMTTVAQAPGAVDYYVIDHKDQVRLAVIMENQIRKVLYREANGKNWSTLAEHHRDAAGWEPIAFDGDNRTLFIWSDVGRKTKAIYRYDVVTRQQGELVVADDTCDALEANVVVNGVAPSIIFDGTKEKVVGIAYASDRTRFHWLDDEYRQIHAKISASLPDTIHRPRQIAADGSKIIFLSTSDRDPGVYYLYDRKRQKLNELAVIKPAVDPDKMAAMKPISFPARDGMVIHGYLTLPRGVPAKNLPLVLHPHGGPFGIRDEWGYRDEVQFYANRGYAVLQINYRGSGGYGRDYEAAGYKKWGLEMQNDLSDGVKWAVDQGLADPGRVVISGASYGGYAVMAGLAYTPELYCAGINYVGATDIELLVPKGVPESEFTYWFRTRIGDLANAADRKRIYDTSPVHFADRVRAPVLMAYGKNDPRVVIEHGTDMERALKKAGRTYEMIIEDDEGHGFRKEEKSIAFFTRVDDFLKKYVPPPGGRVEVGTPRVITMPAAPAKN